MRAIQKPRWLIYAAQVRVELDTMPTTKSGKRLNAHELDTWRKAMAEMGYDGSFNDWKNLIQQLGRQTRGRSGDFL